MLLKLKKEEEQRKGEDEGKKLKNEQLPRAPCQHWLYEECSKLILKMLWLQIQLVGNVDKNSVPNVFKVCIQLF